MKTSIKWMVILSVVTASSSFAAEEHGVGNGGDPLALEFKATAESALNALRSLKQKPFSDVNFLQLHDRINTAQIFVTDGPLPVTKDGFVQDSAAENRPKENLIIINRKSYQAIQDVTLQQALALHEFLSLMGVESTANYPISGRFLITEESEDPKVANQKMDAASRAIALETPCGDSSSTISKLTAMIANPKTTAGDVIAYVKNNGAAPDAVNDQCQNVIVAAIDDGREDIFEALFNFYQPDPSALQPLSPGQPLYSIYSFALLYGAPSSIEFLRNAPKNHLSLDEINAYLYPNYRIVAPSGMTPLMFASRATSHTDMISYLIGHGVSVNAIDYEGLTALAYASMNPNLEVICALIRGRVRM